MTKPASPDSSLHLTPAAPTPATPAAATPARAPVPQVVGAGGGEVVKKADFIDRATARSGVKKKDAKPAIEAALAELADILAAGGELVLPPMGKLKAVKIKPLDGGAQLLTLKLRTLKDGAGGPGDRGTENAKSGVAEDDDDS